MPILRTLPWAHLLGVRAQAQPKTKPAPQMRAAGPARTVAPAPTRAAARDPKPAVATARSADHARAVAEAVGRHNARCRRILAAGVQFGEVATAMALAFDSSASATEAIRALERLAEARTGDHADRRRLTIAGRAAAPAAPAPRPESQVEPAEVARAIAAVAERCRPQPAAQTLAERLAGATRTSVHP
jgi:hypothetical protein